MKHRLPFILPGIFICLLHVALPCSAQHLVWQQFTANEGLPSNDVYDMVQDAKGNLWFATDQGMCSFNGYAFVPPIDTSVQRNSAAFNPVEDANGRIWFSRLDNSIWFIENKQVRKWKYNTAIDAYIGMYTLIEDLAVEPNGTVWLAMQNLGLLKIQPDGRSELLTDKNERSFLLTAIGNNVLYTRVLKPGNKSGKYNSYLPIIQYRNNQWASIDQINDPKSSILRAFGFHNGDVVCSDDQLLYTIRKGAVVRKANYGLSILNISEIKGGGILIASSGQQNGVYYSPSLTAFENGIFTNILPGFNVTDVYCDREGGWWASTSNTGVFYCKNPGIEIFDARSGLPNDGILHLVGDGKNTLYVGTQNGNVCAFDTKNGSISTLPNPNLIKQDIWALYFDSLRNQLWCSPSLCYYNKGQWTTVSFTEKTDTSTGPVLAKTLRANANGSTLWANAPFGFFPIDLSDNSPELIRFDKGIPSRSLAVISDLKGNVWVSTLQGLRLYKNDTLEMPPFSHPALHFPVVDMAALPDGGMVFSLQSNGLLLLDGNGSFTHLTQKEGLCSDYIPRIKVSANGALLACSNAGLCRLSPQSDGHWRIESITMKHGLPSNQVEDALIQNGELWIATDRGLVHFKNGQPETSMPAPVVSKISVNRQEMDLNKPMCLDYKQNNLVVEFYTLYFRSGDNTSYRYRLIGADTAFNYTTAHVLNFAQLQPGAYTFEIQAQNENGQWGPATRFPFEITKAWWRRIWFHLLLAMGFVLGLWWLYKKRLSASRNRLETQNKINELKSDALRAQMNPHFIFNALAAIQYYVQTGKSEQADMYLSKFSKLLRMFMESAKHKQIKLSEDIRLLNLYVDLERMRFDGRFEVSWEIEDAIDPQEIEIPTMLLQPLVDHAINQGLFHKPEKGYLKIKFSNPNLDELIFILEEHSQNSVETAHDVATTLYNNQALQNVQDRIEVFNRQLGKPISLGLDTLYNEQNKEIGARITLRIPLSE